MKNNNTPAFWYVEKTDHGDNNVEIKILKNEPHPTHAPFWTICKVNTCMGGAESEANALLIAAAPEMLAVLEEAETVLRESGRLGMAGCVRDVISKATSTNY